jgi:hypothetical protein
MHDGKVVMGTITQDDLTIELASTLQGRARLAVLLHEVWHGWRWHSPKPKNIEEECDLFANAAYAAHMDMCRQWHALKKLIGE